MYQIKTIVSTTFLLTYLDLIAFIDALYLLGLTDVI